MRTLLLSVLILWASFSEAAGLLVIASPQIQDDSISIKQLADIYSLKKTYWTDKTPMVLINREVGSDERENFAEMVFKISALELSEFWNKLRFEGKQPPLTQISDPAVIGFVRSVPGAIGYINANQQPTGVKVLLRLP